MNRNLHSPTKLTEFARDFDSEPETLLSKFVNKIANAYNNSYNTINISNSPITAICTEASPSNPSIFSRNASVSSLNQSISFDQSATAAAIGTYGNEIPTLSIDSNALHVNKVTETAVDTSNLIDERSPQNVLQRISNLMAVKNNNLSSYKNSELQKFWMPDSKSKECYECSVKFSTFRRKHHCRLCGQIFCSKCCNQMVSGKIINCSGDLKVCTYCSKIVLTYLKSSEINVELQSDLQALQDDLASKFPTTDINSNPDQPNLQFYRKVSVGYQEERFVSNPKNVLLNSDRKAILQQSQSLKSLHIEMSDALPNQNRGSDLVAFLITNLKSSNKIQAIAILNAMMEAEFILPVFNANGNDEYAVDFNENLYYKLTRIDDIMSQSGSFQLDLNVDDNSVHLSRSKHDVEDDILLPNSQDNSFGFSTTKEFELKNNLLSTAASKPLLEAFCNHEDILLNQLLRNEHLDQSWSKILLPICARAANSIRPELCGLDLMDIRNFVNFKKIPGGLRTETKIVSGVVFSKNVLHKNMATAIDNPRVLLLNCAITYQRIEGKFISIENLLLQEREFFQKETARILSFKPNVVLVHKNVAGLAQDMLRDNGITLVLDVKLSVLDRLARCLKCDIITSIDSTIGQPKLGTCDRFKIQSFENHDGGLKTLMFFEIASSPRGGCVLLRGGTNNELIRVKRVAQTLLFARYNWRLEMSFLLDEFARPPSPKLSIFDSKDHSPLKNDEIVTTSNDESMQQTHKKETKLCKTERKIDDKIILKENVPDFSDPLRAPDHSMNVFNPESSVEFAVETPYDNRFRNALSSMVLSISPFVSFPLPYLETEHGRKCALRSYYPNELYYSKQWSVNVEKLSSNEIKPKDDSPTKLKPCHPFVTHKIITSIDSKEMQTLLASFRASGGRLVKIPYMKKIQKVGDDKHRIDSSKLNDELLNRDALDMKNHQRLPVLFCSYHYNPNATSSFCAQPSLLNMIFYGEDDIMLGKFLERYCFRSSYICSSCKLPMLDHVRRYVHSMGCIQVKLTEDFTTKNMDKILMTSYCLLCQEMTPSVPMSKDTWCFSFAKYLELRFHSHAYKRRIMEIKETSENSTSDMVSPIIEHCAENSICSHSLHQNHVQYFSYNGIVASFTYTPVEVWDTNFPSLILALNNPRLIDPNLVLEDIKKFASRGHEVFASIHEKLVQLTGEVNGSMISSLKSTLNQHQSTFREKVACVQTLLTDKSVNPLEVNDALFFVKRILAESIELWSPKLNEVTMAPRLTTHITKSDPSSSDIDTAQICTEDLRSEGFDDACLQSDGNVDGESKEQTSIRRESFNSDTDKFSSSDEQSTNKFVFDGFLSRDSTDKKSVKQILRELLATDKSTFYLQSPIPPNEHYCLPLGKFPIVVCDHDFSSAISYTLISLDYKKALNNLQIDFANNDSTSSCSPKLKRKSQDGLVDGVDDKEKDCAREADKKNKISNHHIEISFQDQSTQFTCKVYFAREFDAMRNNFIKPPKVVERPSTQDAADLKSKSKLSHQIQNILDAELKARSPGSLDRKLSNNNLNGNSNNIGLQEEFEDIQIAFARSISESVKWEARGGKSGSKFCKTLDDRFVLKEMSKQDVTIFENFAPNYFLYVNQCLQMNQPTLLVKIFGVFKVTTKSKDSTCDKSLLIMENLFYNFNICNKFDLKGSDRNRLVDPNGQNGEIVLLDENLIQMSWTKPLYVLSHSKSVLRDAIARDTLFLERNEVMDYSLLVGLSNTDRILVLGIIDYIRTYTFDKKIESMVKQTGILGGQGKLPTVVSPKLYKQRFSEAMERYFLTVPDRWEGFEKK